MNQVFSPNMIARVGGQAIQPLLQETEKFCGFIMQPPLYLTLSQHISNRNLSESGDNIPPSHAVGLFLVIFSASSEKKLARLIKVPTIPVKAT